MSKLKYANEKVIAYKKSIKLESKLPLDVVEVFPLLNSTMQNRTMAPANNRIIVKLEASITLFPNANRHNTEFAANAIKANDVKIKIFIRVKAHYI